MDRDRLELDSARGDDTGIPTRSLEEEIGINSDSNLAIKLSKGAEIYLVLSESGEDPNRSATLEALPLLLRELADVAGSSSDYRVGSRYSELFALLFEQPLQRNGMKRVPDAQGRDDFHGYFRARPGTSYEGVNIKVSHPVYCEGECTRDFARIGKAEYLGRPHQPDDVVFFAIGDNAVYLKGGYTKQFGWFSGNRSFDAAIQVSNQAGEVLIETTGPFRGWER